MSADNEQLKFHISEITQARGKPLGVRVIQLGAQDERTVINDPLAKRLDYVHWGLDNNYPQKFLDKLNQSAFYHRISASQVNMLIGEGLVFDGIDKEDAEVYFNDIGVNVNFINKAAWDVVVLNAFACQLVSERGSGAPRWVYHTRADKVRVDRHLNQFDQIQYYWLARDWSVIDLYGKLRSNNIPTDEKDQYLPQKILKYIPTDLFQYERALVYNIEYNPAMHFYPIPPGEPSFEEIELNNEIIDFQLNSIQNGIAGSVIIKYPKKENPEPDLEAQEQMQISEAIKESMASAQNAGRATVVFYDPQTTAIPDITAFPSNDNDTKYAETNRIVRESIFTGLGVISEELYGIPRAGGFSSQADMLQTANDLTYFNIIKPKQRLILDPLNQILKHAGLESTVSFRKSEPVADQFTVDMLNAGIITVNEFRKSLGLSPFDDGDEVNNQNNDESSVE